jgi:hypothetical protein
MTLEEAKKKILEEKILPEIGEILEFEDFWVFDYPYDLEVDDSPPAIRKDDGSLFYFFPPDYLSDLKYTVIKG